MLLSADDFGKRAFNENGNVWGESDIRSFLNSENGQFQVNTFAFGQGEEEAISPETITEISLQQSGNVLSSYGNTKAGQINIGDELSYADGYMYSTSNYRDKIHLYQLKVE